MLCFSEYAVFVNGKNVFQGTKQECLDYAKNLKEDYFIEHIHYES